MDATELSIITVTYGRQGLLARKVEALLAQTLSPDRFEWCVTTNGDAAAAAWLRGLDLPFALKVTEVKRNGSVAAARNLAVEAATGGRILMSDDDVMPGPRCLAEHLHAGAAGTVVIGDLRLPSELRSGSVREPFERSGSLAGRALWINATGANTSVPRSDFLAVGGYDPAFAAYGGEDSDLGLRLQRRGLRFRRSAAAWAVHVGRVLTDTDKAYLAGRAGVRVWRKNGGVGPALLLGVHPISLAAKRLLLGSPLRRLYDPDTAAYEEAYASGARSELAGAPPRGTARHADPTAAAPSEEN